jgi:hypothetical protein
MPKIQRRLADDGGAVWIDDVDTTFATAAVVASVCQLFFKGGVLKWS